MRSSVSAEEPPYLELTLEGFLERVSAAEPAPAAGSAAALAVALAAGLCTMAARLSSRQLSDASEIALSSGRLRERAAELVQADAAAYGFVLAARQARDVNDPEAQQKMVETALLQASVVPTELAEIGAEVCDIAARIAEGGNRNLVGDAVTAALLSEAAVRAANVLVAINLKNCSDDEMAARAAQAMTRACLSTARAKGAYNS